MEKNEQYLVAVHDLEETLNKDLHNSVLGHNQNGHLTDDHIKNILDDLRSATDRFTKAENKQDAEVDTKSLESCGSRRSETRDTVSKIYPKLPKSSPTPSEAEAQTKSTLSILNRIHQQKNRMLALERIEASIKKNMRRL